MHKQQSTTMTRKHKKNSRYQEMNDSKFMKTRVKLATIADRHLFISLFPGQPG